MTIPFHGAWAGEEGCEGRLGGWVASSVMYNKLVVVSTPQWASDSQAYVVIIGYNGTGWTTKHARNMGDMWVPAQQSQERHREANPLAQGVSVPVLGYCMSSLGGAYGIEALELCWAFKCLNRSLVWCLPLPTKEESRSHWHHCCFEISWASICFLRPLPFLFW